MRSNVRFHVVYFFPLEYRAELYWRLESKRMKALSKENTPLNEVTSADENNNVSKDDQEWSKKVKWIIASVLLLITFHDS